MVTRGNTPTLPPSAIGRTTHAQEVGLYIRRLIFEGSLQPGARVPRDEIAATLGISVVPVREALIALQGEGWVTIEAHRGAFVNRLTAQTVSDHYDLYALLYAFTVRRALRRGPADLVSRLAEIEHEIAATDDPAAMGDLTIRFHSTVVDAAGSSRVRVVLRALSQLVPGSFFELVPGAINVERRGLRAVVNAVQDGDPDRAAEEYSHMMRAVGVEVVQLLSERGLFDVHEQREGTDANDDGTAADGE